GHEGEGGLMPLGAFLAVLVTVTVGYVAATTWRVRSRALRRLYDEVEDEQAIALRERILPEHSLSRWLLLAGYRSRNASSIFVAATAGVFVGGLIAGAIYDAQFARLLVAMVTHIPGGVGEVLASILRGGDWIIVAMASLAPTLVVRAARRRRVLAVEQDLPLALELFATMGEAGLGFDAALAKIVRAQEGRRPLAAEFVNF